MQRLYHHQQCLQSPFGTVAQRKDAPAGRLYHFRMETGLPLLDSPVS